MQGSVKIARILGVEIGLHYSWFPLFALVTWSLSTFYFPARYPFWAQNTAWAAGVTTSVLFFATVLAHELAHSAVAQHIGLEVDSITLFVFGGMASISREAVRARDEFAIAIAGPASSLLMGVLFAAVGILSAYGGRGFQVVGAVAWWLALINTMLGVFNLIPGFPMDGGRVLRSIIWGISHDFWMATRVAASTGLGIAYIMMLGGILLTVSGALVNAVWLLLVGWFLNGAAQTSYRQASLHQALTGVTVEQAMETEYARVGPSATLSDVFETYFRPNRRLTVPVLADDSRVLGLVTADDLERIPRERWAQTPVNAVMTDLAEAPSANPGDEVNDVLSAANGQDFAAAPVFAEGHLVGLLTQTGILDLVRSRRRRRRRLGFL
ncbi:MAG: M50 family metallopeptidase [Chloroflexota bacterium]